MIEHAISRGLYLRRSGPDRAPLTLFYVHGLGESGLGFEGLLGAAPLLRHRQLALDLPGYGKSPWLDRPLTLAQHAELLAGWLEAERVEPVVLLGHSMGGVIGQLLCERWPQRVRAFVNVEGNLSYDDCTFSRHAEGHSQAAFLAAGFAQLCDDLYRNGLEAPALRSYYASLRMCDPRAFHHNALELVALSRSEGLAERFAGLALPRAYLHGRPGGTGERSLGLLERAGAPAPIAFETAGHWPFLDRPAQFARRLLALLESWREASPRHGETSGQAAAEN